MSPQDYRPCGPWQAPGVPHEFGAGLTWRRAATDDRSPGLGLRARRVERRHL